MSPRHRLLGLLVLLGLVWAARDRFAGSDDLVAAPRERGAPARAAAPARSAAPGLGAAPGEGDVCSVPVPPPQRAAFGARTLADPFTGESRAARARAAAAAAAARPVALAPPPPPPPPAPAAPPPPPPAPRLALRYLGHLDPQGAEGASVFLTNGQQVVVAKAGDTVEGGFRLERVGPRELVFVHVQQNHTIRLPVGGENP